MNRPRSYRLATTCALAVLFLASDAQAQRGGPGGFGGGPPGGFGGYFPGGFGGGGQGGSPLLSLVTDPVVWDEIKITDAQLGQVTRLENSINQQRSQMFASMRGPQGGPGGGPNGPTGGTAQPETPEQRAAREAERNAVREQMRATMQESAASLQQQSDAALKKILKPEQFKRVQQIELRKEGPLVVSRPDVAHALNLGADQVDSIQGVINQFRDGQNQVSSSRREISRNRPDNESDTDRDARRAKEGEARTKLENDAKSLKEKAYQQVARILTKLQKDNFNKMLGKDFDLTKLNNGRGVQSSFDGNTFGRGGPTPTPTPPPTTTATTAATTTTPAKGAATTATATAKGAATTTKGVQPKSARP